MNKDQKLLEECYQLIYESIKEPLYFGVEKDKERWMKWFNMRKYKFQVHEDGSVSTKSDIEFISQRLYGKLPFKFNKVEGNFICINCGIKTLEGAPRYVGGNFSCAHNQLTSLKDSPNYVGGWFNGYGNKFVSLEGAPEVVKEEFETDQFSDENYKEYIKFKNLKKTLPELEGIL